MKSTNKFNFVSKFKLFMLIPIILVFVSIIIEAIFGFSLDYDFQKVSNFTVKFNTTVTKEEYKSLESSLKDIVKDYEITNFRIDRIGEGAENGLIVKVPNNDAELNGKLDEIRVYIEENLLAETDDIESNIVVSTSELSLSQPKNITKLLLLSMLSLACIIVLVIGYNWVRYNLMAGLSLATSIVMSIFMLIAGMITFRIPFTIYFVLPFVVMILTLIINATIMNNYIKSTLNNELYNKTTNVERVLEATGKTFKSIVIYMSALAVSTLIVMFFGGASLIFVGLSLILGLLISFFISILINNSLWSFWYKKDRDKVLTRRIEAEKRAKKRKEDIKAGKNVDDEKIVV